MRYDAVIFDLDGTLADTLETIGAALNHGLVQVGQAPLELAHVSRIVGEGVQMLCRNALPPDRSDLADRLIAETRAFYARNPMLHCRLYPGIDEMLDALSQDGSRLAVLSNKPHDLTLATVEGLRIEGLFDQVLGHREDFPRKPDPTSANYIVTKLGVPREKVLYVGDTPIDMQTAVAAGLDIAAVTWGFRSEDELRAHSPKHVVTHPREITRLCRQE